MNPFIYPKSKHTRTLSPKKYKRYQTYKRVVRAEFFGQCVYCRLPMTMKGNEGFGVDHYRPSKHFPLLKCTYSNLFYCCNTCNSHKNQYWPKTPALEVTDFIPNPCDHTMFDHLRFTGATVISKSNPGAVAKEILDLNDPESVSFRRFIIDTIETWLEKQAELLALQKNLLKLSKKSPADAASAAKGLQKIDQNLVAVERNLKRLSGNG